MMFRDQTDAAEQLANELLKLDLHDPVVLGIPRGGIVLGAVIARALGGELDVVLSCKLRAPYQPELALGAVSEDGQVNVNPESMLIPGVTEDYLERERDAQLEQIAHRHGLVRAVRPPADLRDRSVVVTDDGVATGATMIASLQTTRAQQPRELIGAVPVEPMERVDEIARHCDRVVCLVQPADFWAISQFYEHFEPVNRRSGCRSAARVPARSEHRAKG